MNCQRHNILTRKANDIKRILKVHTKLAMTTTKNQTVHKTQHMTKD